jgi:selenocysteine-specific translation elongation factor
VVLNKADLDGEGIFSEDIRSRLPKTIKDVFVISAVTGQGVDELNERLWAIVKGKNEETNL